MFLSYTGQRNFFGDLTDNSSSDNLTLGDKLINIADAQVINSRDWDFLEKSRTLTTVADQQYYKLPGDCNMVKSVTVLVDNNYYTPIEAPNRDFWNFLNQSTTQTSDTPEYWYITEGKIGFYPVPTTQRHLNITLTYERKRKDLSLADYSTGTITTVPYTTTFTGVLASGATSGTLSGAWALTTGSYIMVFSGGDRRPVTLTNGSTDVTFSALSEAATATVTVNSSTDGSLVVANGTTFTDKMEGMTLLITDSSSDNTGDGMEYEIESYLSATCISIVPEYTGKAIAAGTASYTIGQTSLIPKDGRSIPVYKAAEVYYTSINPDSNRAGLYKTLAAEGLSIMEKDQGEKTTSPVISNVEDYQQQNPNLFISQQIS